MKEKKRGAGLKFMGLCFSSHEDHPVTLQQQPHFHYQKFQQYQQFQQNLHNQFPNHLHLRRPHPQSQIPQQYVPQANHGPGRTSPVVDQAKIKSLCKESCKEEPKSSTYELPCPRSPSILYTPKDVKELRQNPGYSNCDLFTFEELKVATKHFRPDLIIGEGGFGVVYRGVIDETVRTGFKNKEVAIKQLNRNGFQGDKEWLTEVSYLGQLSHPNLVKLIGYCCEDEHRLLIYEYMASGCLEKHLFRRMSTTLTWRRRLKILLDAAKGLAYLHDLPQPIIYRDFKTSNVLLDSNFNAKLSDFGLAKEGPVGDQTHVSTRVMGTYGYAAPEYIMTGHLTARSDVYGFGVVLLEMLIGRRALDKSRPSRERDLVDWCRPLLNNNQKILRILDARIDGQYSVTEMMRVANLGYQCLSQNPKGRPMMSQVVEILEAVCEQEAKDEGESSSLGQSGPGLMLYDAQRLNADYYKRSPSRPRSPSKVREDGGSDVTSGAPHRKTRERSKSESHNDFIIFSNSPDI